MKKVFLIIMAGLVTLASNASVTITESPTGTVTIAVDGEAGQIGQGAYEYTSAISTDAQNLIKNAQNVVIKGNINANDIKTLLNKNKANDNNWALNTLDMGGATISTIKVAASGPWSVDSHDFTPNNYTHFAATNVVLPVASDGILPDYFGFAFTDALVSVTLPEGYTSIGTSAFDSKKNLMTVNLPETLKSIGASAFKMCPFQSFTLPNSLESIGDEAFQQCQNLTVIVFPENFKTLGNRVFYNTHLLDIYFLGKEAPIVGPEAFDAGTYKGNGGMVPTSATSPYGNTDAGYAERMNFTNAANTFGLLHLRADLTNEERAKYVDITRDYRVEKGDDGKYKAFYDLYYGENKIWPGQVSYEHTYNDAVNGVLWNGTSTYDKDKYMGLHKFTMTVSNVYNTDTRKWTFNKLSADQWWTICVPFKMTKAQVREVFGENTEVCMFSKVTRNTDERSILLEFKDDRMAAAANDDDMVIQDNISYMIFPTKQLPAGESYVFDGYKMETGNPEPTSVKPTFVPAGSGDNECTYRFIGTYLSRWDADENNGMGQPILMPQYSYFLGAKGDKHVFFYQTGTTGKWNPFTATVQVFKGQSHEGIDDSFVTSSGAKMISLFGSDAATTGINTVTIEVGNSKNAASVIYNIHGQAVRQGTDCLEGLPNGIYIVNGKKYVLNH